MKIFQTSVFEDLCFSEPVGIASSHLTGDEKSLDAILEQCPPFLTLKSTSQRYGANGVGNREFRHLEKIGLGKSFYSFGPYELELLNVARTIQLIDYVKKKNKEVKLGVSILLSEEMPPILQALGKSNYDYLEVNLKYFTREIQQVFRNDPISVIETSFSKIGEAISECLKLSQKPVFLKITRDMPWLVSYKFMEILSRLSVNKRIGLVVANSRRLITPPNSDKLIDTLKDKASINKLYGAVSGNILFPETLTIIKELREITQMPIIASGGIMSGSDVVLAKFFGATAVQICTVINVSGISSINDIRHEISDILDQLNKGSFSEI